MRNLEYTTVEVKKIYDIDLFQSGKIHFNEFIISNQVSTFLGQAYMKQEGLEFLEFNPIVGGPHCKDYCKGWDGHKLRCECEENHVCFRYILEINDHFTPENKHKFIPGQNYISACAC